MRFLGELQGADLRNAYAAARTHALISFYETPGLASLEAAIAGNTIVASDRGSPREYFGDQAFYCQPIDLDSIKAALSQAYRTEPDPALKARVLRDFNWRKTAEATLAVTGARSRRPEAGRRGAADYRRVTLPQAIIALVLPSCGNRVGAMPSSRDRPFWPSLRARGRAVTAALLLLGATVGTAAAGRTCWPTAASRLAPTPAIRSAAGT